MLSLRGKINTHYLENVTINHYGASPVLVILNKNPVHMFNFSEI